MIKTTNDEPVTELLTGKEYVIAFLRKKELELVGDYERTVTGHGAEKLLKETKLACEIIKNRMNALHDAYTTLALL